MTQRIYYTDPSALEFDATVTSCQPQGETWLVTLDRTAFYPTSGGQPFDTGTLGDARVVDVIDQDDGQVGHVTDRAIDVQAAVRGRVEADRRFDHTQQHTGQHILSAAFDRLFSARTVGFHLGADVSTIDLDKVLGADSVAKAEAEANRIVWDDRPVTIRFATEAEAAAMPLRKEPTRTGELRLIEVEGFDVSACGGTHVARTGAVGIVAVRSQEKFRGGLRLEFVCGRRALGDYRTLRDAVAGCIRQISVSPGELPAAIERVQLENRDLRKTIKDLQDRLASFEAAAMVARGTVFGPATVVVEIAEGWDQAGLKALASAAAGGGGVVAALVSGGAPVQVVIARSAGVTVDASSILKALVGQAGGKGGGRPDMAQGGGMSGSPQSVQATLRDLIARALQP